jgi:hypothetical protein
MIKAGDYLGHSGTGSRVCFGHIGDQCLHELKPKVFLRDVDISDMKTYK